MKKSIIYTFFILILVSTTCYSQVIDTLIDVGGSRLHFNIIKGQGIPILFESGGGNDGTIWNNILSPLAEITGTTLITYDRSGLGKSDVDTSKFWILNGIKALENGLKKLGYDGNLILVAHSAGGFYSTLYASRHPANVKACVFFDINHISFFTDDHVRKMLSTDSSEIEHFKNVVWLNTIATMRKTVFPPDIPTIDLVAENTLFNGTPDSARWHNSHKQFVDGFPDRQSVVAFGCGHYIFLSNPSLAVLAIIKEYANIANKPQSDLIIKKGLDYAFYSANESRKLQTKYMHSEDDLNSWGYQLLQKKQIHNAIEIFKLNVSLHPESANAYDSLADGYEANGDKIHAIENYKRCLELDPTKKSSLNKLKILESRKN